MMKLKCILSALALIVFIQANGQQPVKRAAGNNSVKNAKPSAAVKKPVKPVPIETGMAATYMIKNDKQVLIRWAPTTEAGWRLGNKYGYVVERRTIVRDGKLLNSIRSYLSFLVIKDSLQYWQALIDTNDNAAVMAQAIYGESFELDINGKGKVATGPSLLGKATENKQRFLFAMYAADNDFQVAMKSGLGFKDMAVKPNEKYFYRIYPAAPKQYVKSDTALLLVSLRDVTDLPQSPELMIEPSNKSLVVSWDLERTKNYYNSFYIARSADDGNHFDTLNKEPYTSLGQGSDPRLPNSIIYIDTAVEDAVKYKYKVCGVTIFGERGPWSPVAEGKTLPLLEGVPGIQGIRLDEKGHPILNWYFEDSIRTKISGFELTHAPSEEGPFQKIMGNISPAATEVLLPDSLSPGYLVVKAVSKEGLSRTSFPYLFQPEDSIPPQSPVGLKGIIDSTGHVELKWLPNTEKDLLGYKVFRTMVKGTEPAILVDTVWRGTTFYDTLDMKLKNRKIYYFVTALDYRFNQSSMSRAVEVMKPDVIPPTAPVFADYKLQEGAVDLSWVNTTDEDVTEMAIQRKDPASKDWKTIFTTAKRVTQFTDKEIQPEKKYSYKLVATDSSGWHSPEAQVLTIQTLPVVNRKIIKSLDSDLNREKRLIYLRWQLQNKTGVKSIEIFKGDDKEPLSLYKVVDGKTVELLDNDLLVNTKYKYGIRALLTNGQYSEMLTKEINY
jgi:uncharacterized protein